jgi:hypothetical protein
MYKYCQFSKAVGKSKDFGVAKNLLNKKNIGEDKKKL